MNIRYIDISIIMRFKRKIEAYILPIVLLVGTLMILALSALFNLWDLDSQLFYGNRIKKQKRAWLESALTLWEADSTLLLRLDPSGAFVLFGDDPPSVVKVEADRWGLYELMKFTTADEREKLALLAGNAFASRLDAALYVCNNGRIFSLAGPSDIKGKVYTSESGIEYNRVLSDYYSGRRVPASDLKVSEAGFPQLDSASLDSVMSLIGRTQSAKRSGIHQKKVSFFDPTEFIYADNLGKSSFSGNVVVCSNNKMEIDSTSRLNNIIVIAPNVTVREGFRGSLQIIASDSVILERGVNLSYPSGILMCETSESSYLAISDSSKLDGYAIFKLRDKLDEERRTVNYTQGVGSRVRGLVWVDGISQIHGTIMGSLYVNHSAYFAAHGNYTGILYNASVYEGEEMAFPLWMESYYRKKTIKWLD